MFFYVQNLVHDIAQDEPDPAAANALQEGPGGQFGEMPTMMQYLFQSMNFRGPAAKPYRDLIHGIGTEEISHFDFAGASEAGKIYRGLPPSKDGTELPATEQAPGGAPSSIAEQRLEEFSPGLDPELLELIQATAELELQEVEAMFGPVGEDAAGS